MRYRGAVKVELTYVVVRTAESEEEAEDKIMEVVESHLDGIISPKHKYIELVELDKIGE